jgi:hypothetical protein
VTDGEKAAIANPVFLAIGADDLVREPMANLACYRSATDLTLMVLADAGHCHNQASRRLQLWDRLLHWAKLMNETERGCECGP